MKSMALAVFLVAFAGTYAILRSQEPAALKTDSTGTMALKITGSTVQFDSGMDYTTFDNVQLTTDGKIVVEKTIRPSVGFCYATFPVQCPTPKTHQRLYYEARDGKIVLTKTTTATVVPAVSEQIVWPEEGKK